MYLKRKSVEATPDALFYIAGLLSFLLLRYLWLRRLGGTINASWLLLLICLSPLSSATTGNNQGQRLQRNILFSHLTTRDGLSQASVTSITQDKHGFIWFGTQEGLNRYDGKKIEVFEHDYKNPDSLSHDWIRSLLPDAFGGVWIGTNGGGLDHFDPVQKQFLHFRHNPQDPNSLSGDKVRVVYKDRQGILWVGTDRAGLNRFNPKTGEFLHYQHDPADEQSLSSNRVLTIIEDRHDALWIGTRDGGLDRLDTKTGKFTHFRHDPENATSLSHDRVRVVYEDSFGSIWVGTYQGGLNLYQPATNTFKRFQHNVNESNSLSNDRVVSIYQDSQGTLWVATDDGLNEWRAKQQDFVTYDHQATDPDSLSNKRVTSIFQDRGGVLWVGTFNGINKWNYASEAFTHYQESGTRFKLSNDFIMAISESQNDVLWVGTYGGGLNKLDLTTGQTQYFNQQSGTETGLSDATVTSIYEDSEHIMWLGTRSGGLNRLDPLTGKISYFQHDPQDDESISSNAIPSVYGDPDGTLWIATYGAGLNRRDPLTGKFKAYRHDPQDNSSISSDLVMAIFRDRAGVLWIGTERGGLNRFEPQTETFIRYQHDSDNPQSLSNNTASTIHENKAGDLWIGTQGGGVNLWSADDRQKGQAVFKKYLKNDGLLSDTIMAILEDNKGKMWLSSNRGLSLLDPETGEIRNFSQKNGLRSNDFNFAAHLANQQGQLMFGSSTGIVSFSPEQVHVNQHPPQVVLDGHTRKGALPTSYSNVDQQKSIELSYKDELVVFEFTGMDFSAPDKNLYRYQLEGFDASWSEPARFQRTTYTNLPVGKYTFKVMAANNDGVWNPHHAALTFEVVPPPWMSNWAFALYILLIISFILLLLRAQSKKRQQQTQQRKELEYQVELRTHELAERNEQLLQLNDTLKDISVTDTLTGLKNRRYVQDYMRCESANIQRRAYQYSHQNSNQEALNISPSMSFMMIDLDGFKAINDQYGHDAGDKVLLQVRDILYECCRTTDLISRWGGDEFLLVCRDTKTNAVERLAERIRDKLAVNSFQLGQSNIGRISGSIGYAQYPFSSHAPDLISWEQVVVIADRASYLSKQNGRNAWAGIYAGRHISLKECTQIKSELQRLHRQNKISIKTSICMELVFDNEVSRQELS